MITNFQEAKNGKIVEWEYNQQTVHLSPLQAIAFAKNIQSQFCKLLTSFEREDAINKLLENSQVKEFASPNGFPKLFLLSLSNDLKPLEKCEKLAQIREKVNVGIVDEIDGAKLALEVAANKL
jgi:hypothetical protein